MFIHEYPYTNFQEINLDWLLNMIKKLEHEVSEFKVTNMLHFEGAWDVTKQYTKWSLVDDDGTGYVSIVPVPVGVPLDNTDYWIMVANYSSLYASFQLRVVALENTVGDASSGLVKDVDDLGDTVSDLNDEVVNLSGDVSAAQGDITALQNAVGDSSAGLVKDVNDLKSYADGDIYGAITADSAHWYAINNSQHESKGIGNITINASGNLVVEHTEGATAGALVCCPDERMAQYGIFCGASVGLDKSIISLYSNAQIGGWFGGTGTTVTPQAGYNDNIHNCVWSTDHWVITLTDWCKIVEPNNVQVTPAYPARYLYAGRLGNPNEVWVYVYDDVAGNLITSPTGEIKFFLEVKYNPHISAQEFIDNHTETDGANLWLYGHQNL